METINRVEHEEKADSGRLWALAPLVGKYYGTVVCYDGENVLRVLNQITLLPPSPVQGRSCTVGRQKTVIVL
jgi:hypothetical protein